MQDANQEWFSRPASRLRAMGYNTNLNPDRRRGPTFIGSNGFEQSLIANGGMADPLPRPLGVGTILVRFGSGVLVPQVASGEWWLDWAGYRIVEKHADAARISVQAAIRVLCCVPAEWSDLTMIVQARLIQPLRAYEGFGAPAHERDGNMAFDGELAKNLGLKQLFIPGLSDPDMRRDAVLITRYGLLPPAPAI